MMATKLTLSTDPQVARDAKRLAKSRRTTVSVLFSSFITALKQQEQAEPTHLGAVTRRATGLVRLPEDATDKELLAQALTEVNTP